MTIRLRLKVDDISEKVLAIEITPTDQDDGRLRRSLVNFSADEAKKKLLQDSWNFFSTTTSVEGIHYNLYYIETDEDINQTP